MSAVRRAAANAGKPMPSLSFSQRGKREYLRVDLGGEIFFYNGITAWHAGAQSRTWALKDLFDRGISILEQMEKAPARLAKPLRQDAPDVEVPDSQVPEIGVPELVSLEPAVSHSRSVKTGSPESDDPDTSSPDSGRPESRNTESSHQEISSPESDCPNTDSLEPEDAGPDFGW